MEAQVGTIELVLTVFSLSVEDEFNCVITASLPNLLQFGLLLLCGITNSNHNL